MQWRRRNNVRRRILLLSAAAWVVAASVASADDVPIVDYAGSGAPAVRVDGSLLLVQPTVNGMQREVTVLLRDHVGRYYADAETLADWRMAPPFPLPVEHDGRSFYALDAFRGLHVAIAERTMSAIVTAPPEVMLGTRQSLARASRHVAADGAFGAFLDYDVAYTDDDSGAYDGLSGLLSPTLFTRRGSLSASALYQNEESLATPTEAYSSALPNGWIRLDTAWTRDNPEAMTTLALGDAITPYGSWGRSVHFGGIQFGTNFATRPYEITFPQPSINGSAAVPSAVDILVNGMLQSRTDVPSGAFQLDNVPVVTGAGQIQVVTRDLLGREQVVTQDFYVSERLLRRGLNEYSLSAGALREGYGYESNSYGDFLISGMLRRGVTDVLTVEGRVDGTSDVKSIGGSVARTMGRYGVTSFALALSDGIDTGSLLQVGHEFNGRVYRANVRVQSSRDFVQPGVVGLGVGAWPDLQILASGGRNFGRNGSLGLTYIDERFAQPVDNRQIVTLSYSRTITRVLVLSATASHYSGPNGGAAVSVTVSRTLGPRSSVTSWVNAGLGSRLARVEHRYDLPVGPGFGYRTGLVGGDQRGVEAEIGVNTRNAFYSAEAARREGVEGWRLQTRGSLAVVDGEAFAAREINEGFAVVDAAGMAGVRVYLENREIGVTNRNGHLLVPSLRPYQSNQVRIEMADLPLTARVDADSLRIAPYYRSGAVASFGIEASASALMRAVLPDRSPVPEGARAHVGDDTSRPSPVGMDGRLYLEDVHGGARVHVTYGANKSCTFTLPVVPVEDGVPDLGNLVCRP
jgi:outer membrane usher protein